MSTKNSKIRAEQNRRAYLRRLARKGLLPDTRAITLEDVLCKIERIGTTRYGLTKAEVLEGLRLCIQYER